MSGTSTTPEQEALYRAYRDEFLALQPCAVCGNSNPEPAHVEGVAGKRLPGQGTVPTLRCRQGVSLLYALPLCAGCHRTGPHAFHNLGQRAFSEHHWGSAEAILTLTNRYVLNFLVSRAGANQ